MRIASQFVLGTLAAAGIFTALPAHAGKTLDTIKQRDQLVCGVNVGLAGFSAADSQGKWTGLDVDVCKAIAATILGDPNKVKWVPLNAQQRFTALQSGEVYRASRHPVAQHHLDAHPRRARSACTSPTRPTTTAKASWSPPKAR